MIALYEWATWLAILVLGVGGIAVFATFVIVALKNRR